ncbi:MAG: hypothetical protein HZY79_13195 [Rhodoblastus sp.]|nr:MAG: hypothetical protein HZY79_13195 [Rhodoblastus sp.]
MGFAGAKPATGAGVAGAKPAAGAGVAPNRTGAATAAPSPPVATAAGGSTGAAPGGGTPCAFDVLFDWAGFDPASWRAPEAARVAFAPFPAWLGP